MSNTVFGNGLACSQCWRSVNGLYYGGWWHTGMCWGCFSRWLGAQPGDAAEPPEDSPPADPLETK